MRTNCVNCGAAIETDAEKCPFCGTSYFDLTAIDFTANDPVALKLRLPCQGGTALLSMLARPRFETLEVTTDRIGVHGGNGKLLEVTQSRTANANISFEAVAQKNHLYSIKRTVGEY